MLFDLGLTLKVREVESQSYFVIAIGVQLRRNITLVPGLSYEINCNREGGFGSAMNVWFLSNGTPVQQDQPENTSVSHIYNSKATNNDWKLYLLRFKEADVGEYTCKGDDSHATLAITSGENTIAIAMCAGMYNNIHVYNDSCT